MVPYASNINFLLYNTDRTETTSICQLDYADSEKIIPKLVNQSSTSKDIALLTFGITHDKK